MTEPIPCVDHWEDVITGSLLGVWSISEILSICLTCPTGLALAFFSYRQFFPSLTHSTPQVPLAPRVEILGTHGPLRATQEEREPLVRTADEEAF